MTSLRSSRQMHDSVTSRSGGKQLEEIEEHRKTVEDVSGGSDVDVERNRRCWARIL